MKYIFDELADFRDSVVHPNIVSFRGTDFDTHKMESHLRGSTQVPLQAADCVIALIRKINKIINKGKNRLFWLHDRDKNVVFPDVVFN
jgi:hypothetical protein